ncbi:MAG: glycerate kinase [Planctomycetes bacterium]|nr:glycerate kinase [Planctomycetota bacterium]
MKIVLAPNAFKGSISASAAAAVMARGARAACPEAETVCVPVADGGDGLAEVLKDSFNGVADTREVRGPLDKKVSAMFCHVPGMKLAVVEMATASGIALLRDDERNPMLTTTYGTGELITAALDLGCERIIVGIGGSATTDGGIGMASALGYRFLNAEGNEVSPTGGGLSKIDRIDASGLDPRVSKAVFEVVCDVDNPLLGERGAARVYGPQKGATPEMVEQLEAGLSHLADLMQRDLGKDIRALPGAGAAGGLGAGLCAFCEAELRPGMEVVLDLVRLDEKCAGADLVLTAEGQIDYQTAFGKAPAGVAGVAKKLGIPCAAIAGGIGEGIGQLHSIGIDAVFSLCSGPMTLEKAMAEGEQLLEAQTEQVVRLFAAGRR